MMTSLNEIKKLPNCNRDNLNLGDISIPEIPEDIIFPNELNIYLKDQVQYLAFEKAKIQKILNEKEKQLAESKSDIISLKSQLAQYEKACIPSTTTHANVANTYNCKIVELSKNLREKCCELEKYKTKCSKLEQTIVGIQMKNKETESEESKRDEENESDESENKIKYLQDNLNFTKVKLCEIRNTNLQLKNELKQANKFLLQEVGESLDNLQKNASSTNTNWRGRAQIICDLQQKNNDLREKIKSLQDKDQGKWDVKKEDHKRIEILQKENEELKKTLEETKKRIDALRARCKVYESESVMLKAKLSATTEQNDKNSQLIEHLTSQISGFHEKQNLLSIEKQNLVKNLEKENKNLKLQLSKEKCSLEKLQNEFNTKTKTIEMLKSDIENKNSKFYYDSTNSDIRKLEGDRIRLVELTEMLNNKLENEKERHFKTQSNYLFERQRAAKLEVKLARIKTEGFSTNRSSNYSYNSVKMYSTQEELENQLELARETIKSLETKLNLEKQERAMDFEKFTSILKSHTFNVENDWD